MSGNARGEEMRGEAALCTLKIQSSCLGVYLSLKHYLLHRGTLVFSAVSDESIKK